MQKLDNAKPFIRWAGSKKKIIPCLKLYWNNDYKRYFEPFVGSAQLFFSIRPKEAVLSDINNELINTYLEITNNLNDVYQTLINYPICKEKFIELREVDLDSLTESERAARFIFLNRFCFNGLYRTNKQGKFNVPYSNVRTGGIPSLESFQASASMLKSATMVCGDFEQIIKQEVKAGDFVYLDPPYAVNNKRIFRQYGPQTFGVEDIARLIKLVQEIDSRGAKFLLSYAYDEELLELFSNWHINQLSIQRNISGFSKFRRIESELLVSNVKL